MATDLLPRVETDESAKRFRLSRVWKVTFVIAVLLVVALAVGSLVQLPVYSLQPGPARDVTKLVSIRGEQTFPASGALLLTTVAVSSQPISLFEGLASVFDPATELVRRSVIVGPGLSDKQQDELNLVDMLQSKYAAAVVAFRALGRPVPLVPGARIVYVFSDSPATGKLMAGDTIVGADGLATTGVEALTKAIRAHAPGREIKLEVVRDGVRRTFMMRTKRALDENGKPYPAIGVSLAPAYHFPVDVQIDTQDIGGPSGGLVFSLALVEVLGRDDLTKGHVVAATGTIDLEGRVGEIGGIEQKVRAAEHSGADYFIVPLSEANDAKKVARSVQIIGVRTLEDALAVLRAIPSRAAA